MRKTAAKAKAAKAVKRTAAVEPAASPAIDQPALLARWKQTRSPRLADILCCVPVDDGWEARLKTIARMKTTHERAETLKALKALPDDPRTTVFLIAMLRKPTWAGSGFRPQLDAVLAKLVAMRDRRAVPVLAKWVTDPPHFQGASFTREMCGKLATTADKLADLEVIPDDAQTTELADAQHVTIPRGGWLADPDDDPGLVAADDLIAKVWAAPDDLVLRSVIGDALLELGDPWGDFISLLAHGHDQSSKPIKDLIRKHGARFSGPLNHVGARDDMEFELGFVSKCRLDRQMVGRRKWEEVIAAPHWATVKRVEIGPWGQTPRWFFPQWLTKSNLISLREISVLNVSLSRKSAKDPWTFGKLPKKIEWKVEDTLDAILHGMPLAELRRIPPPPLTKWQQLLARAIEDAS